MMPHDAMRDSTELPTVTPDDGVTLRSGGVERRAVTFGRSDARMFGWVHAPVAGARTDLGVVICNPWGADQVNAHRSVREMADALAETGATVLRFDYPGCGDSAQDELDGERLSIWEASVRTAADALRAHGGCRRVVLAGVRLGGALAAMAWRSVGAQALVLWHPVVRGSAYVREVDATARFAAQQAAPDPDLLEYAGNAMNPQTVAALREVDLQGMDFTGLARAFVIHASSASVAKLAGRMREAGVALDLVQADDLDQMVCEARHTVVPRDTIAAIAAWVGALAGQDATPAASVPAERPPWPEPTMRVDDEVHEHALTIVRDGVTLFGIACGPGVSVRERTSPTIVFLNSGADNHIAPGRLYVKLARALAREGCVSVRVDLAGLGDSAVAGVEDENAPFPRTAMRDAANVFAEVQARFGAPALTVVGLCSGATHAFLAGACVPNVLVQDVVLLNPMTFRERGQSVSLVDEDFNRIAYMRREAAFLGGWGPMWRIRRNWTRIPYAAAVHGIVVLRSFLGALARMLGIPGPGWRVADALDRLRRRGARVSVLVSPMDPGFDILRAEARFGLARGLRDGSLRHHVIADADHIFGTARAQRNLIEALRTLLVTPRRPD